MDKIKQGSASLVVGDQQEKHPVVSVLLPVNRVDRFFIPAVESILTQTLQDFELIIIANGCSTEHLNKIRLTYGDHNRVRILNTEIKGLPFALNLGVHNARGLYIARMDADDISIPERLEKQLNTLEQNKKIGVVSSGVDFIDENDQAIREGKFPELTDKDHRRLLPLICCIAHPTVMVRKEIINKLGGYSFGSFSEDYDLWLRIMRELPEVEFYRIPESLLKYRRHGNQATSSKNIKKIRAYNSALKIRELFLSRKLKFIIGIILPARMVTLWRK
ncbi:glycosyltransferase [Pseudogulbenkiania ferrooxidans]|uniref:Glycosyl transferase family 2 n=1 Tax=Pseudogulbenkiania ferrooxidans 2002 TaxID=279714 RepID=B9YZ84_9NEIS|nr:glycosyltransferase [Pseudogulbenkiania ferrooxidans]EEG10437.1 glycosyl transferase family 2 [Pseudogulbenkiania ferrooxidans 2002]